MSVGTTPYASDAVVITGIGCVSPLGEDSRNICRRLRAGRHGFTLRRLAGTRGSRAWSGGWVKFARPAAVPQAVQFASRSGILAYRAAELALSDARLKLNDGCRHRCAVVFGTHFGSIESVHQFDEEALRHGKRYVSATLFPNTVINAPAGYVGASFRLRGPNMTISTGISSGLSALVFGQELLLSDQADVVLAGGYDTPSALVLSLAAEGGMLHPDVTKHLVMPRPLDRGRRGLVLGEGAAVFVLERHRRASKRRATILAGIRGVGRRLCNGSFVESSTQCIKEALRGWQSGPRNQFAMFLGANGSRCEDIQELQAIEKVFKEPVDVTAPKSFVGELGGANAMIAAFAAWSLTGQFIPPTLGLRATERRLRVRVMRELTQKPLKQVLVNSFDAAGEHVSLLLERLGRDD